MPASEDNEWAYVDESVTKVWHPQNFKALVLKATISSSSHIWVRTFTPHAPDIFDVTFEEENPNATLRQLLDYIRYGNFTSYFRLLIIPTIRLRMRVDRIVQRKQNAADAEPAVIAV